jgi:hypothetical protein
MLKHLGERERGVVGGDVVSGLSRCLRGARLRHSRWPATMLAQRAMEEEVSGHGCGASQALLRENSRHPHFR